MLTVERIIDVKNWEQLADQWDRFVEGTFTMRHAWLRAWWDVYGKTRQLYILCIRKGDRVVGWLPCCLEKTLVNGRTLQMLGSGKPCSDNVGLICEPGLEQASVQAVARFLLEAKSNDRWDYIDWDGVQPSNDRMKMLRNEMEEQIGLHFCDKPGPQCWSVSLDDGLEGFMNRISKRTRRMLRAQVKDYLQTGRAVVRVAETQAEAEMQLEQIAQFHQARWKERGIVGCFGADGFEAFLLNACRRLGNEGLWFSLIMSIDGQECCGLVGAVLDGTLSTYLVGTNPEFLDHRPGWTMNYAVAQWAVEHQLRVIDFMRGDEEYKVRLGGQGTEQVRWTAAAPRTVPRLRQAAWKTGVQVRDWLRAKSVAMKPQVKLVVVKAEPESAATVDH